MIEYGYIENGYLRSKIIEPIVQPYIDSDGEKHTKNISVEEQIATLSSKWKPVDIIDENKLKSDDDNYIIRLVPYDAGDHIAYEYKKVFDRQKFKKEIENLKKILADGDYKIIKCYESFLQNKSLPYDIAALSEERQQIRNQINKLEESMTNA